MYLISHRGNINGPQSQKEKIIQVYPRSNTKSGFHCEVDVYGKVDGEIWLGHDGPGIKQMISF